MNSIYTVYFQYLSQCTLNSNFFTLLINVDNLTTIVIGTVIIILCPLCWIMNIQGMLNIDRNTIRSSGIHIAIDVSDDFKQTMMSMSNFQSKVCVIWKGNPLNTLSTVFQSLFCCGYLSKSFDYTKIINANCNEINSLYVRFPDFLIYIHLVIFHYFEFKKE